MRNHYSFKVLLAFLFMLPVVSFAAALDLTPSSGDVSMGYLRATFGTVENVFEGTGSYIIGQMFRVFNGAVLTVGGFALMYILIVSTINTAHSGETLGKNWSTIWVPVRAFIGIALLLPKGSGYCLIQTIVMWVVVQGIGAADRVWEGSLTYLNSGGILITEEEALSPDYSVTEDAEVQGYAQNLAAGYLRMAACNYAMEKLLKEKALSQTDKVVPNFDATLEFTMENVSSSSDINNLVPGEFTGREVYTDAYEGACGQFKMGGSDHSDEAKRNNVNSVVALAHQSLYAEMSRIARRYVDSGFQPLENEDDSMAAAAIEFFYTLKVASDLLIEYSSEDTSFIDSAKDQGWMMAGIYYYKLTAFTNKEMQDQGNLRASTALASTSAEFENLVSLPSSAPNYFVELTEAERNIIKTQILNNSSKLNDYITEATANVTLPEQTNIQGVTSEANATAVLAAFGIIGYLIIGLLSAAFGMLGVIMFVIMGVAMGRILWALTDLLVTHSMNPLVGMSMLGFNTMDLALTLFLGGGIGMFAIGVGASVGACMNPLPYALQMLLQWAMPILAFILVAMMTSGAVLMLYIPMIPFLVFIFAAMGWFFSVIEAMVAAPLVALGLIHPEGHEVFGKGESSIMLLLNVFLRPAMLTIGFIVTSVLSFIGIWLLNIAYFEAFFGMMFANPLGTAGAAWLIAFPLSIFVYAALAIYVLQYIFDYMPKLADEILIWIGGPSRGFGSGAAQAAGQLKGGVAGAAQGLGTAMGKSMAMSQNIGEKVKANEAEGSGDTEIGSEDGGDIESAGSDAKGGG